jgi:hypothetical protein
MGRMKLVWVLLIAALFVADPILHNHSLIPSAEESSSLGAAARPCAACINGVVRIPAPAPAVSAPQAIVYSLAAAALCAVAHFAPIALPSRAPPSL